MKKPACAGSFRVRQRELIAGSVAVAPESVPESAGLPECRSTAPGRWARQGSSRSARLGLGSRSCRGRCLVFLFLVASGQAKAGSEQQGKSYGLFHRLASMCGFPRCSPLNICAGVKFHTLRLFRSLCPKPRLPGLWRQGMIRPPENSQQGRRHVGKSSPRARPALSLGLASLPGAGVDGRGRRRERTDPAPALQPGDHRQPGKRGRPRRRDHHPDGHHLRYFHGLRAAGLRDLPDARPAHRLYASRRTAQGCLWLRRVLPGHAERDLHPRLRLPGRSGPAHRPCRRRLHAHGRFGSLRGGQAGRAGGAA